MAVRVWACDEEWPIRGIRPHARRVWLAMTNAPRPYLDGAVIVAALTGFTLLGAPQPRQSGPVTTEDVGCDPGIHFTRVHRPGGGATPEAAVDALIKALTRTPRVRGSSGSPWSDPATPEPQRI